MAKVQLLKRNSAGGVDLLTERDAGNQVLILTGKPESSLRFWRKLQRQCQVAIDAIKENVNIITIKEVETGFEIEITEKQKDELVAKELVFNDGKGWRFNDCIAIQEYFNK